MRLASCPEDPPVPVDLERLKPTAQVRFPGRTDLVTLVAVRPGPFWEFYFDGPDGPGKHVLAEAELDVVETLRAGHLLEDDAELLT
jgi:hypothetical protein